MSRIRGPLYTLTGTSPASAITTIVATVAGLEKYDEIQIDAILLGATGGTLDVYLQRQIDPTIANAWVSFVHFTQLAAAATQKVYSFSMKLGTAIIATDLTSDTATGTLALAAGAYVGGCWGDKVRLVAVGGTSTTAGAVQTVYITPYRLMT